MTARPLYKVDSPTSDDVRFANLERRLSSMRRKYETAYGQMRWEKKQRQAAEARAAKWEDQSQKWRALLLLEQVKHLPERKP